MLITGILFFTAIGVLGIREVCLYLISYPLLMKKAYFELQKTELSFARYNDYIEELEESIEALKESNLFYAHEYNNLDRYLSKKISSKNGQITKLLKDYQMTCEMLALELPKLKDREYWDNKCEKVAKRLKRHKERN